ncbi:hypothetical protein Tco_0249766, partial [Tanacetum coccineum]
MHKKNVSKQGRKIAKGGSTVQRDPQFDEEHEDKIDHFDEERAQSEGRTRDLMDEDKDTDKPKLSSEEHKVSTEQQREGTEEKDESTAGQIDSTEDQTKEEIPTEASHTSTQSPTSMIFGDDETIATLLINMS